LIETIVNDFNQEFTIFGCCAHENIIKLYGISQIYPQLCLVMEYFEYGTLKEVIYNQDIELSPKITNEIMKEIVSAIKYLHDRDICHQEIRSDNIFVVSLDLGNKIHVKIGDCKYSHNVYDLLQYQFNLLPLSFQSIWWIAPEILSGDNNYTNKVDTYSFGILIWELLVREYPTNYLQISKLEIVREIMKGLRPPIKGCNSIPKTYKKLLWRCFDVNAIKRPTFSEIHSKLFP